MTHGECCRSASVGYFSILVWFLCINATDGEVDRHNIYRTSPRWTSKWDFCRKSCMFAGDINNAYARAWVLSPGAMLRVRVRFLMLLRMNNSGNPYLGHGNPWFSHRIKARTHDQCAIHTISNSVVRVWSVTRPDHTLTTELEIVWISQGSWVLTILPLG